jgi:hypothetical protein
VIFTCYLTKITVDIGKINQVTGLRNTLAVYCDIQSTLMPQRVRILT